MLQEELALEAHIDTCPLIEQRATDQVSKAGLFTSHSLPGPGYRTQNSKMPFQLHPKWMSNPGCDYFSLAWKKRIEEGRGGEKERVHLSQLSSMACFSLINFSPGSTCWSRRHSNALFISIILYFFKFPVHLFSVFCWNVAMSLRMRETGLIGGHRHPSLWASACFFVQTTDV